MAIGKGYDGFGELVGDILSMGCSGNDSQKKYNMGVERQI